MTYVRSLVVAAALAGAVAGCGDPYYPNYGYSQATYYPSAYSYPSGYYAPSSYTYYPSTYSYSSYPPGYYGYRTSSWDNGYAYRNYNGIHPGPERNFP